MRIWTWGQIEYESDPIQNWNTDKIESTSLFSSICNCDFTLTGRDGTDIKFNIQMETEYPVKYPTGYSVKYSPGYRIGYTGGYFFNARYLADFNLIAEISLI